VLEMAGGRLGALAAAEAARPGQGRGVASMLAVVIELR
jgi:hypothetical protein